MPGASKERPLYNAVEFWSKVRFIDGEDGRTNSQIRIKRAENQAFYISQEGSVTLSI